MTPWTVAHQAPLSIEFSRQEYWYELILFSRRSSQPKDRTHVSCIGRQILYQQRHLGSWLTDCIPIQNKKFKKDKGSFCLRVSLVVQAIKNLPATQETQVQSLGREDPLEKELETHSSTLAWRIPWTEKPGGLQFIWSQRAGQD